MTRGRTKYSVLRTGDVNNDRNFDAIAATLRDLDERVSVATGSGNSSGSPSSVSAGGIGPSLLFAPGSSALVRRAAAGAGVLAGNGTELSAPFLSQPYEAFVPYVRAFAPGTLIEVGTGKDVEAEIYNEGADAGTFMLRLRNNAAVPVAYVYVVGGIVA